MAKKGHFFLGFILGATSALATTYLLTPQTSDELRRKFTQKKDDLADRAADYYDYAREATADWRESATDLVGNLKDKAKPADADLSTYDEQTQALKDELTAAPEVAASDDFDDIVLDGKSAFAQAKDSADDVKPAPAADDDQDAE
ncbi:MAG: YtxH domain-containing protein [Lactobacillus sp.]|jgi:gas vesicle protein|nr:YtxH domain-containing protein [Lactobacillus sp.]MCI2033144.1 YtxH domain-containing protein [Lactobacillus sp.]